MATTQEKAAVLEALPERLNDIEARLTALEGGTQPTPTLKALSLSSTSLTQGTAATVNILNATAGSAITGTPPDGMTLNSSARTISGTPTTAGTYSLVLTETASGVSNSPRQSTININVASAGTPTPAPAPTMSFANPAVTVAEGNSGTQTVINTINVVRNGVTGALTINLTYAGTATSGSDYVAGPTSVTIGASVSSASFDLTINGDTAVEQDETIVINAALSGYSATASKTITITNDDTGSGVTGYYANGASNNALYAALSGVKAGNRRGKIVVKGDSVLGTGEGGGTGTNGLVNAKANRMSTQLASVLTGAGVNSLDTDVTGDNGAHLFNSNLTLADYNPAVNLGAWRASDYREQDYAGCSPLVSNFPSLVYKPTGTLNTVEVVVYNIGGKNLSYLYTGDQNVSNFAVPSTGKGFSKFTALRTGGATSSLSFEMAESTSNTYVRSVRAYNSAVPAMDFVNHGCRGATAANQAYQDDGTEGFYGNQALAFDAPDLTIIGVGLNDRVQGVGVIATTAAIGTMIDTAKVSGDVLVVLPMPSGGNFANNEVSQNNAVKALCSSKGVGCFSLYEYFGGTFDSSKFNDGMAHPTAATYGLIANGILSAMKAMVAGRGVFDTATLGPELVANGTFDSPSGWTLAGAATIANGVLTFPGNGGEGATRDAVTGIVNGATYRVSLTYTNVTQAIVQNPGANITISGSGTLTQDVVANKTSFIPGIGDGGSINSGTFDNYSVKKVG